MRGKLSHLVCFVLLLALAGTNVVFGDIWEGRIEDTADAVEDQLARGMYSGSSDLEFPNDGGLQVVGLRFSNVMVPKGASVDAAHIEFIVDEIEGDLPVNLIIDGELTVNPANFGSSGFDVDNRTRTNAKAFWQPEHFPQTGQAHRTSDISSVIEEIVGQANWASGGDLVITIYDNPDNPSTGLRTVETGGSQGPLLHIEWSLGNTAGPDPADGQTDVSIDADLSWTPGIYAAAANGNTIYFSENLDDATNGVGGITQTPSTYDPGRLDYGKTYYWRVRANNGPPDSGVNEGRVWSFTTEYYSYPIDGGLITVTASSSGQADFGPENTINGSGLNDSDGHSTDPLDMWISNTEPQGAWIQYEFDRVYKLHEMWVWNSNQDLESFLGFGLKDVTVEYSNDGAAWTVLADAPEFAQAPAPATNDYKHDTTVDFGGVPAKYVKLTANANWGGLLPQYSLSEVRFFQIPVSATTPSPDSGASGVEVDVVLGWRAGRGAVTHNVSFSADRQAVIEGTAPVATAADASYIPPELALETSYYWEVAEVNEAETPSAWKSGVWSFTTNDHVVVEDFESYNDIDPPDPESNRIFEGWPDGFGVATNGALVGNDLPPYLEKGIVHGGRQSMPMFYSNTLGATFSETTHTFAVPQDWTKHGVTTLMAFFQGVAGNTGQLYLKVNGTKVAYDGSASNLALQSWQPWAIDLASLGVNLQTINSLAIGVDGVGATGTLYFDDVGLYEVAPAPVNEWRVTAGSDDAEEHVLDNGAMEGLGSSDLELGYEGAMSPTNQQTIGCRWLGIPVPPGSTITEAWVQFSADDVNNDYHVPAVSLIIEGELSPDPDTFASDERNISKRATTAASVVWDVPQWTTVHAQGPEERTPDISGIIQEIVNQPGWAGNIVLMFKDNPAKPSQGTREAESFDGDPSEAPLLHISYQ